MIKRIYSLSHLQQISIGVRENFSHRLKTVNNANEAESNPQATHKNKNKYKHT